ncbi:transporter [Sphingobacteriaceae bacterium]|nr:transporter [Sphingobacteriaceae bacterium]
MKHLSKLTLILVLVMTMYQTEAQEANKTSFSLQESIDYSLKHSPNYLNAELDLKSADFRRKEITGMGLPQIAGSIDFKDYLSIPTSLLPAQIFGGPEGTFLPVKFGTKYNATAGLSANWNILNSDYFFGLQAQKEYMNLSKISVTRSKADLVSQVTKAYYTVVISRDRLKSLDANIVKLKKTYDDTKATNAQGIMFELIDVERLEVQYNNLLTEQEKTLRLIEISASLLKFQMGYAVNDPITLTDSLNVESNFQELSKTVDVTQRPDYKLLTSQQTLLDLDVKRLKYQFLPSLTLYGSYQYNAQRNEFNFFEASNGDPSKKWFKVALVGATLNLNIFTGWQRMNRIEQTKITAYKNQNTIKNLELAAQLEASTASVNYTNAYSSLLRQKKNLELAEHVAEVARKKYQSGIGSNIEVVTAESDLTSAQTNYYNSVFDMIVAKTDYLKATGTLVK